LGVDNAIPVLIALPVLFSCKPAISKYHIIHGVHKLEILWTIIGAGLVLIGQKLFERLSEKALDKTIDNMIHKASSLKKQQTSRAIEKFIDTFNVFDVVQSGWKDSLFNDEHVEILVDGKFKLNDHICSEIRDKNYNLWLSKNLQNNEQIGLTEIDPHRISDSVGEQSHILKIRARRIDYFDFLSTNRILLSGNKEEKDFIAKFILSRNYLEPVKEFANPISVGLTVFCEDGKYLVLTKRSSLESGGGWLSNNAIFNAVGETVAPIDVSESVSGYSKINPILTAKRGIYEELGIIDVSISNIKIHSFIRDCRLLDYKFFGYFITSLSRSEIQLCWSRAPDKSESNELVFYEVDKMNDAEIVVHKIVTDSSLWSKEAAYSTIISLIINNKISEDKVHEIFGKR
jgi:hypothetical protein